MAAVIQFCNWCKTNLLIQPALTQHMTDVEGLDSVDSFGVNRTTSQVCEDIKSMRRAPDPTNANATIRVTTRESMTIHCISKYGKLLILVQRTHTPALGTIPNLLFIGQFYDENPDLMEGDSYPLTPHPPKFNNHDGQIMMENIESWARTAYGYCGIRLDYIFLENSELPVAGDPGFLQADDGSRSIEEELVQRAAHTGAVFRRNNQNFGRLIGAFNNLELNGDPCSDANKVDVLLEKTVGDSSLSYGRSHITGDAVLQSNFQGAIDYLTTQVLAAGNNNTQRRNRQLAAFTRGGGGCGGDGRSGGRGRGNGATNRLQSNVPDRFSRNGILLNDGGYSNQIWREEFTQEERNICLEMRHNRCNGGGCGGRGREGRGGRGRGISAVHDGRADQEETKEESNNESNNDGRGAGAGMSRRRR
ncbi:unnamed protein product [Cylindrotheca closterium]|uniref:Uncharacterized protein n=1 Tax=Cylindrotheca closterium TaxID=2856 RepID=A0AAD2GCQ0_9STRA|nr:unnamed protein product [Cylindrotheca closterium]